MVSLKDFVSLVRTEGMTRNCNFSVELTVPLKLNNVFNFDSKIRTILLFCDAATLPGISLATTPNRSFGEVREVPYEKLFDNLPLSFYVDNTLIVKRFYDEWLGMISNSSTRTYSYYNDYITTITVTVYDKQARPRYKVMLHEAYPKQVGNISMDYANKEVMKLNVSFVYKYVEVVDIPQLNYGPDYKPVNIFGFPGPVILNPMKYINDFLSYQNHYSNTPGIVENGRNTLFGDSQGIFTGTGNYR